MTVASNIFKAILTRLLFAAHALVTIFWVTYTTKNSNLWYLSITLVALVIETIQCIIYRRGNECKWVSFSITCYLATTIPCAWIMELYLLDERLQKLEPGANSHQHKVVNNGSVPFTPSTTNASPLMISISNFTDLIEQTTMLMLILGRWLLPKGSLTRESLSQLLLVNLAMSADIIEFFDILKLEQAKHSKDLVVTILSLWTISLLQFPVNATAELGEEVKNSTGQNNASMPTADKSNTPHYINTRQGRRQSRVSPDYSLQAPLSDRMLSIVASPNRRFSVQTTEINDVLSVFPNTQLKPKHRAKRNSIAMGMSRRKLFPDERSARRLSVDVSKVRNNDIGESTFQDVSSNKNTRRYSRDVQGRSRGLVHITADRINSRRDFERGTSLDSAGSQSQDNQPKHRVTMDLIGTAMALFLQDGPFLTFRLFMIAKHSAIQYMIVFLTVKNALLVVLQIYKITVQHCVCHDNKDNDFSPENRVDAASRLNNVQIAIIHEDTGRKSGRPSFKARRGKYNRFSVRWSRTKASLAGRGRLFKPRELP